MSTHTPLESVAIWGLRHGLRHAQGLSLAGVRQLYLADPLGFSAIDGPAQVQSYMDFRDSPSDVDAIVISLPSGLHSAALELALASRASRIWIEKPILAPRNQLTAAHLAAGVGRVEVIHELRRSEAVRAWLAEKLQAQSIEMSWRRPPPTTIHDNVVHDLGSHLIDLAILLAGSTQCRLEQASATVTDSVRVTAALAVGSSRVSVDVSWDAACTSDPTEVAVSVADGRERRQWASVRGSHRHLRLVGDSADADRHRREADWYSDAFAGKNTGFTSLAEAEATQRTCNAVIATLPELAGPLQKASHS